MKPFIHLTYDGVFTSAFDTYQLFILSFYQISIFRFSYANLPLNRTEAEIILET
jgi:hypothetical protein